MSDEEVVVIKSDVWANTDGTAVWEAHDDRGHSAEGIAPSITQAYLDLERVAREEWYGDHDDVTTEARVIRVKYDAPS